MNNQPDFSWKLTSILIGILLIFNTSFNLYSQNWSYDTLSEKKVGMGVAVIGNKIFFHSGSKKVGSSQVRVDKIDIFDVQTGIRTTIPLPEGSPARTLGATAVVGGKVLFAGGNMGDATNWVDIFDTATGVWTSNQLSLDRFFLAGAAANGKAFFGGGFSTSTNSGTDIVDVYNSSTGGWSKIYFPSFARRSLTSVSIKNKIFFAGGRSNGSGRFNTVMIYDAETNKWLPNATLSQPKDGLTSLTYKNKVYFIGGTAWNQSTDTTFPSDIIDIYDDATDSWSTMTIPRLMTANSTGKKRAYIKSAQAGCKMFLVPSIDGNGGIGGMTPGNGDTIAVYDFARDSWSYLALPHPRTNVTIAAAKNKVYFAGGSGIEPAEHQDVQRFNHIDILTLEPKLQLAVNNTAITQYDFGPVLTGEEETITIDVSNEGDYDLLFEDFPMRIDITGDVEDFTIDAAMLESIDTLAPAEVISLPVTFSPITAGAKQINISIYSNDPENPVYSYTVKGTGDETTAVHDAFVSNNLHLYPNPTTGLIHITSPLKDNLSVEIVNSQGVLIKEEKLNSNNTIDISSFPEGLYFVKISNETFSEVVKVMRR